MPRGQSPFTTCRFFEAYFKKLPSISNSTISECQQRGLVFVKVVFVKEYSSSAEKPINILKRGHQLLDINTLPSVISPKGLDVARQWYRYDEIRPFCRDASDSQ